MKKTKTFMEDPHAYLRTKRTAQSPADYASAIEGYKPPPSYSWVWWLLIVVVSLLGMMVVAAEAGKLAAGG